MVYEQDIQYSSIRIKYFVSHETNIIANWQYRIFYRHNF